MANLRLRGKFKPSLFNGWTLTDFGSVGYLADTVERIAREAVAYALNASCEGTWPARAFIAPDSRRPDRIAIEIISNIDGSPYFETSISEMIDRFIELYGDDQARVDSLRKKLAALHDRLGAITFDD